jgi:hypothetical protein
MKQATKRIQLGAELWADVYPERLRRTARLYDEEVRRTAVTYEQAEVVELGQVAPDMQLPIAKVDYTKLDQYALDAITVLNQVAEWSFGPVTYETLETMPEAAYKQLVEELDTLYAPSPLG